MISVIIIFRTNSWRVHKIKTFLEKVTHVSRRKKKSFFFLLFLTSFGRHMGLFNIEIERFVILGYMFEIIRMILWFFQCQWCDMGAFMVSESSIYWSDSFHYNFGDAESPCYFIDGLIGHKSKWGGRCAQNYTGSPLEKNLR